MNSELQTLKDSQLHQKKRITEMFGSMLKELNEIGTIIGSSNDSLKVQYTDINYVLIVRKFR